MGEHATTRRTPTARTIELIRTITGVPGLAVELLDAVTWSIVPRIAGRFSRRRCAAHVTSDRGASG